MTKRYIPKSWRYEKSTKTIRAEPENYWIATMDSIDGAVDNDANAELIAAAPETKASEKRLLEACKAVTTHKSDSNYVDFDTCFDMCKAAIDKATP